jgi:hypothetical protein
MLKNYKFITTEAMAYFSARPPQAHEDSDFALACVDPKRPPPGAFMPGGE